VKYIPPVVLIILIAVITLRITYAAEETRFFVYIPLVVKSSDGNIPDPTPQPTDPAQKRAEVIAAVNIERDRAGCAPIIEDAALTSAAQAWTDYLVEHNILAHSSTVDFNWYGNHGYTATDWVSENIAGGTDTGSETVALWMDSPAHRATLLQSCANTSGIFHIGVGWQFHTWTLAIGELHD
jgi:uncharacterized protein YkwD